MQPEATPDERRAYILQTLADAGRLTTAELSLHFGISEDSARRDFRQLATEGLIQRVHGAALPVSPAIVPFAARYKAASGVKDRLALKAATFIVPNQVVLFDGGTTNLAIARHIPSALTFTAITNSPQIAIALSDHINAQVVLLGGKFDKHSQMCLGASTIEAIGNINVDLCFYGVHSIDAQAGLTTSDYDEAVIKRSMINAASEVIGVATNDKIGTASAYKVGESRLLNRLVCEQSAPLDHLTAISAGGTLIEAT